MSTTTAIDLMASLSGLMLSGFLVAAVPESQISSDAEKISGNVKLGDSDAKAQMRFIGTFAAGYKDVGIYRMLDVADDVICYVLMPENASNKIVQGKLMYEGNSVGSISCVKGR
jgi:hypothetical protein